VPFFNSIEKSILVSPFFEKFLEMLENTGFFVVGNEIFAKVCAKCTKKSTVMVFDGNIGECAICFKIVWHTHLFLATCKEL